MLNGPSGSAALSLIFHLLRNWPTPRSSAWKAHITNSAREPLSPAITVRIFTEMLRAASARSLPNHDRASELREPDDVQSDDIYCAICRPTSDRSLFFSSISVEFRQSSLKCERIFSTLWCFFFFFFLGGGGRGLKVTQQVYNVLPLIFQLARS